MCSVNQIWGDDWRVKIRGRVRSLGCETIGDFLSRYPSEHYYKVARRLGSDVAAVQLAQMQFEEVADPSEFRQAAMDGIAREIVGHLKRGWGIGKHADFNTAGAYTGWMALLQFRANAPDQLPRGDAVWSEIRAIKPPQGWLPSGPDDPIIKAAFARAWSPDGELDGKAKSLP